eukprot:1155816-Pelagomonas_calceolata.AAC.8
MLLPIISIITWHASRQAQANQVHASAPNNFSYNPHAYIGEGRGGVAVVDHGPGLQLHRVVGLVLQASVDRSKQGKQSQAWSGKLTKLPNKANRQVVRRTKQTEQ